jgi:hypothetical protein
MNAAPKRPICDEVCRDELMLHYDPYRDVYNEPLACLLVPILYGWADLDVESSKLVKACAGEGRRSCTRYTMQTCN